MSFFKKMFTPQQEEQPKVEGIAAPAQGVILPMAQIPDEVFAQGVLGQCCGIDPADGKIYAPVDGTVTMLAHTLHAFGMQSEGGIEILVHAGVDTVDLKGQGFEAAVKEGEKVKAGQLLLTMNVAQVRAAGFSPVIITVVTNTDDYAEVCTVASGTVKPGDDLLRVIKK